MRFVNTTLIAAALMGPIVTVPVALKADPPARVYHDEARNDDHHWDNHEDAAYRMWVREHHRRYVTFEKLSPPDQQAYWAWRHEHSDAVLKINIH